LLRDYSQITNLLNGLFQWESNVLLSPKQTGGDRLFEFLVGQPIQGNEHQRPTFPGSGGRFNQQILFAPPKKVLTGRRVFAWGASPVDGGRGAIMGVGDGNGGNGERLARYGGWMFHLGQMGKLGLRKLEKGDRQPICH